jgi:hypothetical protein
VPSLNVRLWISHTDPLQLLPRVMYKNPEVGTMTQVMPRYDLLRAADRYALVVEALLIVYLLYLGSELVLRHKKILLVENLSHAI